VLSEHLRDQGIEERGLIQGLGTWQGGLALGGSIAPNREVIEGFGLSILVP